MRKKRETQQKELASGSINIISIVDVSFVLVIFCMATMSLILTAGINVLETKAGASKGKAALTENISIKMTKDNKLYLNNQPIDQYDLFRELSAKIPNTKDKMVIITADDENTCEQVVEILDISRKSGAKRLALMQGNQGA
ncbi:MAG: biopolymer transporter ExbD [Elusimicrobia bacterium]|nr:biopolymer transporter ExbD [Elusimicrobiota bacterium]